MFRTSVTIALKHVGAAAGTRVKAKYWSLTHRDFLVVFNWHQVSPSFDPLSQHEYTWTQLADFQREVEWLASEYKVLPLPEGLARLQCGRLRGRCAALTFDDGDASMEEYVLPFLKRRGWPASFFINSAYLESPRSYWFPIANYFRMDLAAAAKAGFTQQLQDASGKLRRTVDRACYNDWRVRIEALAPSVPNLRSRLVTPDWLSKLDGEQFTIGTHGHEHQRFSMMTEEWQRNDLQESVRILSQFHAWKPIFAVPFGRTWDWNDDTLRAACDLGLDALMASGGINVSSGRFYKRMPGDHQELRLLIKAAMAQPGGS